jgi:hypothetical protein
MIERTLIKPYDNPDLHLGDLDKVAMLRKYCRSGILEGLLDLIDDVMREQAKLKERILELERMHGFLQDKDDPGDYKESSR